MGVVEEIAEVVGPGQEVDRDRDSPDPHRSEKDSREHGGVVDDQQNAVLPTHAQVAEPGRH